MPEDQPAFKQLSDLLIRDPELKERHRALHAEIYVIKDRIRSELQSRPIGPATTPYDLEILFGREGDWKETAWLLRMVAQHPLDELVSELQDALERLYEFYQETDADVLHTYARDGHELISHVELIRRGG